MKRLFFSFFSLFLVFLFAGCIQTMSHFDPDKDLKDIKPISYGQPQELKPISSVYFLPPLKININEKLLTLSEEYEANMCPFKFPTGVLLSRIFEKDESSKLSLDLLKTSMNFEINEFPLGCLHAANYEMIVIFKKNGERDVIPISVKGCGSRGFPWAGRDAIEKTAIRLYEIAQEKLDYKKKAP